MTCEPKIHHYVPRFYLKRFSSEQQGKVFVLFKELNNKNHIRISEKPVNIQNICAEDSFYALLDGENRKNMQVEKLISKYESIYHDYVYAYLPSQPCIPIWHKAVFLKDFQKILLSDSLTMQIRRGLLTRRVAQLRIHTVYNDLVEEAKVKYEGDYTDSDLRYLDDNKKRTMGNALKAIAVPYNSADWEDSLLAQYLRNMTCVVLLNSTRCDFVTSDEPVLFYNHKTKEAGLFNCSLYDKDTTIFYPLGPKSMLLMYQPGFLNMGVSNVVRPKFIPENNEGIVRDLNIMQYRLSHRFVIASKGETLLDML